MIFEYQGFRLSWCWLRQLRDLFRGFGGQERDKRRESPGAANLIFMMEALYVETLNGFRNCN